jgi:23S rRNA (adenine2503-C2)-methyltransferase
MMQKPLIQDQDLPQLSQWLQQRGIAPYRAGQILRWIYARQTDRFEDMTDLGMPLRRLLEAEFTIGRLQKLQVAASADGSRRYLFGLGDGNRIESVLIPERGHDTLCISSQVGCALACRFCRTGQGGLVRNLTAGEILSQVRDVCNDVSRPERLTNIVLMGMGEPLANYENLVAALNTLTDTAAGFGFAGRRITVSTAGLAPRIEPLGRDTAVNLAVSLNATDNTVRDRLMPINRTYPIEMLLDACRRFPLKPHRRITFEYILIEGVNDSDADARRLAKLLQPIRAKINLIPFNTHEACEFRRPEAAVIERFQAILLEKHYTVVIRRSKGQDIDAACGQLSARYVSKAKDREANG